MVLRLPYLQQFICNVGLSMKILHTSLRNMRTHSSSLDKLLAAWANDPHCDDYLSIQLP